MKQYESIRSETAMNSVWSAQDATTIKIITTNGIECVGRVIDITDVGEESEDYGFVEDSITIAYDGRHVVFPQSEIKDIIIID